MGALVEALQWWRSDEGELVLAMAMAALGAEAAAAAVARKDEGGAKEMKNGAWDGSGGRWRC